MPPEIAEAPHLPGVYRWVDDRSRVLYVGKAKDLHSRLSSYRHADHPRTLTMLARATSVSWEVTANEADALLLEAAAVRRLQPQFNVRLRHSDPYPHVVLTGVSVPELKLWRGAPPAGARRWGPYTNAGAARDAVAALTKAYALRQCSAAKFSDHCKRRRACLLGDIGSCCAPCVPRDGGVSPEDYAERVAAVAAALDGDVSLVPTLEASMRARAEELDFEAAAVLRDRVTAVRAAVDAAPSAGVAGDVDVLATVPDAAGVAVSMVSVRDGRVVGTRGLVVDGGNLPEDLDDEDPVVTAAVWFVAAEVAAGHQLARTVAVDGSRAAYEVGLRRLGPPARVLRRPRSGPLYELVVGARRNAAEHLRRVRSERAADPEARANDLAALADVLGLPGPLWRIEALDISHSGGRSTIGALAVLEDATVVPKLGRAYRLEDRRDASGRTVPDDPASIGEAVTRRMGSLATLAAASPTEAARNRPDLLLVDGGPAQLAAACVALARAGCADIPVCSLAKRFEEVYVPGRVDPIRLPAGSPALLILQRARDATHALANRARVKAEAARVRTGVLDQIPGVGPVRAKALRARFKTKSELVSASVADLAAVVGPKVAAAVHAALQADTDEPHTDTDEPHTDIDEMQTDPDG